MVFTLLQRYISATIAKTTGLVLFLLVGLDMFILFVSQLHQLGSGEFGLWQVIYYVCLSLPAQIYTLFPMVGLLGALLGLNILATHSELIVMRASGFSITQISFSVMQIVLVMVIFVTVLGETVAPWWQAVAEHRKEQALTHGQLINTRAGTWIREGQQFLHIERVAAPDQLIGVSRYAFDTQHRLIQADYASVLQYDHRRWIAHPVWESHLSDQHARAQSFPEKIWPLALSPQLLKSVSTTLKQMSFLQLSRAIAYQKRNGLRSATYELEFWKRLFQPLATVVMTFLAIPFLFGSLRSATLGLRLLIGVLVGFSFYILNEFFGPLSLVFQFPPIIAAALPTVLFALLGWILMSKATAWQ